MAENEAENQFRYEMLDFKRQMVRFVEVSTQKFDGIISDLRNVSFRMDKLGQKVDVLDGKVTTVSSKIDQVTDKVILHEKRLRVIEEESSESPTVN